jgi:hypothetical protein
MHGQKKSKGSRSQELVSWNELVAKHPRTEAPEGLQRVYSKLSHIGIHWENDDIGSKEDAKDISNFVRGFLHGGYTRYAISEHNAAQKVRQIVDRIVQRGSNGSKELLIFLYGSHGGIDNGRLVIGSREKLVPCVV